MWKKLVEQAIPVIDYTFNMVIDKLDLTAAGDKSSAVDKLLPIIVGIKNNVRRDHYLTKLAEMAGTSYHNLEAALSRIMPDRRIKETRQQATDRALQPIRANPLEEYCLMLLLKYPELKARCQDLLPEYFENSVNREISIAWQQVEDISSLKERLDIAVHEQLDSLLSKSLPTNQIEYKFSNCILRLRERFLRSLEVKRGAVFALEAETKGAGADLAKLEEQGIEVSVQLGEVFTQRGQKRTG